MEIEGLLDKSGNYRFIFEEIIKDEKAMKNVKLKDSIEIWHNDHIARLSFYSLCVSSIYFTHEKEQRNNMMIGA